jgi:hypothetical protein
MGSIQKVTENFNEIIRPKNLFDEVKKIISLIFPEFNYNFISNSYKDIIKLFKGGYSGYQKCDTKYHDLKHTEDCLLVMARLIHGAFLSKRSLCEKNVNLGLISAIMHDTGYIKASNDRTGTGGKYTKVHIARSIKFLTKYLARREFNSADINFCSNCIKCTGLLIQINTIEFISPENELMGKILGTADLIGQMSGPFYLKKLPNLFKEFQEADIKMYDSEFDLLEKTPGFWEFTKDRFETELDNVDRYLRDHFRVRWGIDRDLDREAIEKNIDNLKYIIKNHRTDYHHFLRSQRYGAVSEANSLAP